MSHLDRLMQELNDYDERLPFFAGNDKMYGALLDWIESVEIEIVQEVFRCLQRGESVSVEAQDLFENIQSVVEYGEDEWTH